MFMSVAEVLVYQKPVFIKSSLSLHQLTLNTTGIRSIFAMYEKYFTDMITKTNSLNEICATFGQTISGEENK